MKHVIFGIGALSVLSGCAVSQTQETPPPPNYWTENGIQRAGQEFIHEGYIQNGVIVSPSRNWFYGQGESFAETVAPTQMGKAPDAANASAPVTDAQAQTQFITHNMQAAMPQGHVANVPSLHPPLPDGGQKLLVDQYGVDAMVAPYGSALTPGSPYAYQRGTAMSMQQAQAMGHLEMAGRYIEEGSPTYTRLDQVKRRQAMASKDDGQFNPARILGFLDAIDPGLVEGLNGRVHSGEGIQTPVPLFALGKAMLRNSDKAELDRFAGELSSFDNLIVVGGYTDPSGTKQINELLAKKRSEVTGKYLIQSGLNERVLLLYSRPQCCYVEPNDTEKNRAMNRRAEISLRGQFLRIDASDSETIARGLSRVFKTLARNPNQQLRIYGVSQSAQSAKELAGLMKEFLTSPQIGLKNVGLGEAAEGARDEVVIEITNNTLESHS